MAAIDPETLNRATAQALNPFLKPPDTVLRSTFLSHPLISAGRPNQADLIAARTFALPAWRERERRGRDRHTGATKMLAAGEPVHVVAQFLGHSKVQTTLDTYTHVLPAQGEHAVNALVAEYS